MKVSLFKLKILSNLQLVYATGLSFLLQMAIIYVPVFQPIFKTEALNALDLSMIMVFSSLPLWIMELVKALNRKFRFYDLY
jgi:Ca2+-transporting ATPase